MLAFALVLKAKGLPVPEIAGKLVIKDGRNAGENPSVASVYRALAEAEEAARTAGSDRGALRAHEQLVVAHRTGWSAGVPA
ncbi:hypothetical protein ACFWWM_26800 [Streptomyces sp. NPDC058682]|uniref:hypothetical protein n=1 Tax=Streptomyces sp. NPDC058682 TaxID=3346596 RepID=UPI00364D264F